MIPPSTGIRLTEITVQLENLSARCQATNLEEALRRLEEQLAKFPEEPGGFVILTYRRQ